jgi:hypothetical protein
VFTPVLAKHPKSFSLIDCIAVGVDRTQRNLEPMRRQETWQRSELTDVAANVGFDLPDRRLPTMHPSLRARDGGTAFPYWHY